MNYFILIPIIYIALGLITAYISKYTYKGLWERLEKEAVPLPVKFGGIVIVFPLVIYGMIAKKEVKKVR